MSDGSATHAVVNPERPPGAFSRGQIIAQRILIPLLVLFAGVLIVFNVAFGTARVVGTSMLPNLRPADGLLLTRGYADPRKGDVVVITIPAESGGTEEAVKRVVGVPGDVVRIVGGLAVVNGVPETGYALLRSPSFRGDDYPPAKVPAGQIYIMGDNRPVSFDSRYIGTQPISAVKGRAVAIFMPIGRVSSIRRVAAP